MSVSFTVSNTKQSDWYQKFDLYHISGRGDTSHSKDSSKKKKTVFEVQYGGMFVYIYI